MHLIEIFTDGSCHTQLRIGAWAAIVFVDNDKTVLTGQQENTTHNQMELVAIIKAIEFVQLNFPVFQSIKVVTDSQYAVGLKAREIKFTQLNFQTKSGAEIQNSALVKRFLELMSETGFTIEKIKAHQKKSSEANFNIEADKRCRKILRELVHSKTSASPE